VRPFESREAVMNWIIDNQLGRRNMTPEAKSYLRGKRYQLEKKREGHPSEELHQNDGETAQRLAQEYGVGQATIERDADFAEAVDTLEEQVRQDIRQAMLKRKRRDDKARLTKKQTTRAGTAVKSVLRARV
jgi:hypothetical protein